MPLANGKSLSNKLRVMLYLDYIRDKGRSPTRRKLLASVVRAALNSSVRAAAIGGG
jgi:hypothetical protein